MGERTQIFRSLAEEIGVAGLASIAGYHDIDRIHMVADRAGDRLVLAHELIHDRLLRETAFGAAQYLFREAAKAADGDALLSERLMLWMELLIANSLNAHESAATYLCIKDFPVELHDQLYAALSHAHQDYYKLLSSVVDPLFPSTFVQYAFGKVIVETAMCPPICKRLLLWTPEWGLHIDESEAPDKRLQDLLAMIRGRGREPIAFLEDRIRGSRGRWPANVEPSRERSWEEADEATKSAADAFMFAVFREWVYSTARVSWPVAESDDWLRDANSLWKRLASFTGRTINRSYKVASRLTLHDRDLGDAIQHGRARIQFQNPSYESAPRLDERATFVHVFSEPPGPRSFITMQPRSKGSDTNWYMLVAEEATGAHRIARIPESLFFRCLAARTRLALMGMPVPTIDSITIGVESGDEAYFADFYAQFVSNFATGDVIRFDENVVWYLSGDFFWWYDLIVAIDPHVKFMFFWSNEFFKLYDGFKSPQEILAAESHIDLGPQWIGIRAERIFGTCFHIFPALGRPSSNPSQILSQEVDNKILHVMDKKVAAKMMQRLEAADRLIASCWPHT